jgi:hypothetical protein
MNDVLEILVSWAVSTTFIFGVIMADERRMEKRDDPRLERAWPPASRSSAIIGFGVLAVPLHFLRTRRSFLGLLLAIGFTALALLVETIALAALDAAMS